MFTEEHRIIIKYLRIKYGDGAKKIVKDHPEFDWKVDGVRHLIEKIDATGSIARKEGSGRPRNPTFSCRVAPGRILQPKLWNTFRANNIST